MVSGAKCNLSVLFFSGLPQLPAYYDIRVSFQFRTLESNGLLMYNAGKGRDFLALELVDGHVHYIVCLGGHSEVTVIKDESPMVWSERECNRPRSRLTRHCFFPRL